MPLPKPKGESRDEFADRCMVNPTMLKEYPDQKQRFAVCMSQYTAVEAKEDKPLNKPFRTPDGPKKFAVYVKNDKGNVVKVNFGDSSMEIKRDDPERRKNFRSRMQCDTNPGPKWKARYWSCRMWESGKSVSEILGENYSKDYESYMARSRTYPTENIVHAISSLIEDDMPDNIQYLPPSQHTIHATKNGKPAKLTVEVTQKTADLLQKSFDKITATGIEQVFLDFNHDDGQASAWVKGFYWGGDAPEEGGVRAKVEWTTAGEDALRGKNFRKFSPTFTLNAKGEIDGTTVNAGGLVNRPAFKEITPVIAVEYRDGETVEVDMQENAVKAQEGEEKDKAESMGHVENGEMKKKEEEVSSNEHYDKEDEVESTDALKDKIKKLEAALNELTEEKKERDVAAAKELVDQAVEEGRIPAQNEEVRAKWQDMLIADPSTKDLLLATPVDPAFDRVISAKGPVAGAGALNKAEAQMREVQTYQAKNGCSFEMAWTAVSQEKPELF